MLVNMLEDRVLEKLSASADRIAMMLPPGEASVRKARVIFIAH